MQQIGYVMNTEGDMATVQIRRPTSCGENCAMCKSCGESDRTLNVINSVNAAVGQNVRLELATWRVLLLAFLTYIVPLILFAVVSFFVESAPGLALTLILSFVICSFISNRLAKITAFQSRITQILGTQKDNA